MTKEKKQPSKKPTRKRNDQPRFTENDIELAKKVFAITYDDYIPFDITACARKLLHDKAKELGITSDENANKQALPKLHSDMLSLGKSLAAYVRESSVGHIINNYKPQIAKSLAAPVKKFSPASIDEFEEMGIDEVLQSPNFELQYEPEVGVVE